MNSETEDGNKSMELLIEEETKETNRDKLQSQRINEFINDLKEAIESGKLHKTNMLQQSAAQLNKLINVDNLSNQTFTYIINWLKQQQEKKTNLNFTNKVEFEFNEFKYEYKKKHVSQLNFYFLSLLSFYCYSSSN
jgi:hypothetical protein